MANIQVKPPKLPEGGPGLFSFLGMLLISFWSFCEAAAFIEMNKLDVGLTPAIITGVVMLIITWNLTFGDWNISWKVSCPILGILAGVSIARWCHDDGMNIIGAIIWGVIAGFLVFADQYGVKKD